MQKSSESNCYRDSTMCWDRIIEDLEVDWEEIIPEWAAGHTASHYQESSQRAKCARQLALVPVLNQINQKKMITLGR